MATHNQPTRTVKVQISLRFKPALKVESDVGRALLLQGNPPGVLAQQIVDIEIPINVSNAAMQHDARFVLAVERARERLMDEMIDMKHEILETKK